jgi:hypothetical protein
VILFVVQSHIGTQEEEKLYIKNYKITKNKKKLKYGFPRFSLHREAYSN